MKLITAEQLKTKLNNGEKLLVDFDAEWCGPCKSLMPRLEKLEQEFPHVQFVKIDVDQNQEYMMESGIRSVPTVKIYDGEKLVNQSAGANPDKFYEEHLVKL
jgi:thioredoxin 1